LKNRLVRHGVSAPVTIGIDHSRNSFGPLTATTLVAAAAACSTLDMKSTRALR
jgi:hypothetical protein